MNSEYSPSSETELLYRALISHADNLKNHTLNVSSLASLNEEIELYRRLLKRSQGEGSACYQLCVNLLTLSRFAANDDSDDIDIKEWISTFKIFSELYERIVFYLDALQEQLLTKESKIISN